METALHRQLKTRFGTDAGGRTEVALSGFRIDAIDPDGALVEVQSGSLGPLRGKVARLLSEHRVRIVKPVVVARRIVRRARRDGRDLSCRMSPKRGAVLDVFDDLMGLIRVFPHPNLRIDVVEVAIDEVRIPRRRWPGFRIVDRVLRELGATRSLSVARDLWNLLPTDIPDQFTTLDLAEQTGRRIDFAQKIAWCLRTSGAAEAVAKRGNRVVYRRATCG